MAVIIDIDRDRPPLNISYLIVIVIWRVAADSDSDKISPRRARGE